MGKTVLTALVFATIGSFASAASAPPKDPKPRIDDAKNQQTVDLLKKENASLKEQIAALQKQIDELKAENNKLKDSARSSSSSPDATDGAKPEVSSQKTKPTMAQFEKIRCGTNGAAGSPDQIDKILGSKGVLMSSTEKTMTKLWSGDGWKVEVTFDKYIASGMVWAWQAESKIQRGLE